MNEEMLWAAGLANRLRESMHGLSDESPERRLDFFKNEIRSALEPVTQNRRKPHLEVLQDFFPEWMPAPATGPPAPASAPAKTPEDLAKALSDMVRGSDKEKQRVEGLLRVAGFGLTAQSGTRTPEELVAALSVLAKGPGDQKERINVLLRLAGFLAAPQSAPSRPKEYVKALADTARGSADQKEDILALLRDEGLTPPQGDRAAGESSACLRGFAVASEEILRTYWRTMDPDQKLFGANPFKNIEDSKFTGSSREDEKKLEESLTRVLMMVDLFGRYVTAYTEENPVRSLTRELDNVLEPSVIEGAFAGSGKYQIYWDTYRNKYNQKGPGNVRQMENYFRNGVLQWANRHRDRAKDDATRLLKAKAQPIQSGGGR